MPKRKSANVYAKNVQYVFWIQNEHYAIYNAKKAVKIRHSNTANDCDRGQEEMSDLSVQLTRLVKNHQIAQICFR